MAGLNPVRRREIRDRPRDLQDAVEAAAREFESLDGLREEIGRAFVEPGLSARERAGEAAVAGDRRSRVAAPLSLPTFLNPLSYDRARLGVGFTEQIGRCEPGNAEPDIDPVEKRPGELLLVCEGASRQASTRPLRVTCVAARTRIRGGNECDPGRELHGSRGARHQDAPAFEWLAEPLEGIASELGDLIEEQDPVMRERHFARTRKT
jgi:hypothetical protein